MTKFDVVSVDLDDTLIHTSQYYQQSSQEFGRFVSENFGVKFEEATEVLEKIDKQRVKQYGVKPERYPESFVEALRILVPNSTKEHRDRVYNIGASTFKSEQEYAEEGFIPGSVEMLNVLEKTTDEMHLVTLGDISVQQPKINALKLHNWFDEIHTVTYEEGKSPTLEHIIKKTGVPQHRFAHIGDSATSDVKAAISVGSKAVYISNEPDWLSDNKKHNNVINHNSVYHFHNHTELVSNIDSVIYTQPEAEPI